MYNHYDSYPKGKGIDIAKAVKDFVAKFSKTEVKEFGSGHSYTMTSYDKDACKKKLIEIFERIRMIEEDAVPTDADMAKYLPLRGESGTGLVGAGHEDREWYSLLHDLQGNMDAYLNGNADAMIDAHNYMAEDSLFCEWAYVINIDTMKLEVWRGFQTKKQKGNRYGTEPTYVSEGWTMKDIKGKETKHPETNYYPCKLIAEFNIFNDETPEYMMGVVEGLDWDEKAEGIYGADN
jgi:hypothetical protein